MALPRLIGIAGKMRSGKDTAAGFLVEDAGYRRLAFADALKDTLLRMDPIIVVGQYIRLTEAVSDYGWESAKDFFPEVRRLLQRGGQGITALDPDFWVRIVMRQTSSLRWDGHPVVVADVRYPNEAKAILDAGGELIRIVRPDASPDRPYANDSSETALDGFPMVEVANIGTPEHLRATMLSLAI